MKRILLSITLVLICLTVSPRKTQRMSGNPILPEFHADPEVMYSHQTGKFYIYSTTDGVEGWGGYYFTVFSSADLTCWQHEGIMLDLGTQQVAWASGNAWAPCIEEKLQADGTYKYYFYFSGHDMAKDRKSIGVAVADSPTGPYVDLGHPLIDEKPEGVRGGQQIDVDVFTDPVSGKSYLYWGNGYMAGAELNDDMVSIRQNTVTVMTPRGGTLEDYAYREGTYVFYRNGKYYFLWSVDDTGSPNYHVAYGTSDSPLGPIEVAQDPVILFQRPEKEIYGPAHNSVLQIPGRDEWYIVYHRINKDYLYPHAKGPGFHRQVCIDRMEFNEDGTIRKVTPTQEGIPAIRKVKK
ncbi:MAG: family 43 glycosylhydrolase [Bacteroidaceae bacterium]|nr:family 43 glycosylhydrolase [Bacteroidaceae bacterium]